MWVRECVFFVAHTHASRANHNNGTLARDYCRLTRPSHLRLHHHHLCRIFVSRLFFVCVLLEENLGKCLGAPGINDCIHVQGGVLETAHQVIAIMSV